MVVYDNIERMWFGTEQKMGWIETPQTGADVSSIGQSASSILQNGGGNSRNSWDSHKTYQFSWGSSASQDMVSLLQSYRNGSYGRGLLYFHDPMFYFTNLLPKRWADPSMAVNYEAEPLIPDANPTAIPVTSTANNYPINAAVYNVPSNYSSQTNNTEHFIPIPTGMTLVLGAVYQATSGAALYVRTPAGITNLIGMSAADATVVNTVIRNQPWARLGIRNTPGAGTLTITGMTARLADALPASDGQPFSYTNLSLVPSFEAGTTPIVLRTNGCINPKPATGAIVGWSSSGGSVTVGANGFTTTNTASATPYIFSAAYEGDIAIGDIMAMRCKVRATPVDGQVGPTSILVRPHKNTGNVYYQADEGLITIPVDGNTYDLSFHLTSLYVITNSENFNVTAVGNAGALAGFSLSMDEVLIEKVAAKRPDLTVGPCFWGGFSPDVDMTGVWTGTVRASPSNLTGIPIVGMTVVRGFGIRSTQWAKEGSYSLRLIPGPTAALNNPVAAVTPGVTTLDATGLVTSYLSAPLTGSVPLMGSLRRSSPVIMDARPNIPGEYAHRIYGVVGAATSFELWGGSYGGGDIWFDLLTIVAGDYAGPGFTGRTPGATWSGAADLSTSTWNGFTPISGTLGAGPWYSGEGHSGCRFNGNPTVINYNGVNGGQLGLSAIFQEVGAWE